MKEELKAPVLILLAILCIVDVFTTILGLYAVVRPTKDNPLSFVFCIAPAIAILVFLLMTHYIWHGTGTIFSYMRLMWSMSFAYDLWTAFIANTSVVIFKTLLLDEHVEFISKLREASSSQLLVIAAGTIIVSSAPILISHIVTEQK